MLPLWQASDLDPPTSTSHIAGIASVNPSLFFELGSHYIFFNLVWPVIFPSLLPVQVGLQVCITMPSLFVSFLSFLFR
jgi:hypothetical protein